MSKSGHGQIDFRLFLSGRSGICRDERRVEQGEEIQFSWYMGMVAVVYIGWVFMTWLGTIFGNFLEDSRAWGIDVLMPVYSWRY